MKKYAVILIISLLLVGCIDATPEPTLTPEPTNTPSITSTPTEVPTNTPIPTSTPVPCRASMKIYVDQINPVFQEFNDNYNLAQSTARIALSPVIAKMQQNRRDIQAIEPPACGVEFQRAMIDTLNGGIDGFMAFMAQESSADVQKKFNQGAAGAKRLGAIFDDIKESRPPFDQ